MGKGGCFFNFLDMGLHVIRRVMGCIICFFIIGPILIIVGIVMLASPNNRNANVAKFNTAVSDFSFVAGVINNGTARDVTQSTNLNILTQQVYVSGNTDGVVANRPSTFYSSPGSVSGGDTILLSALSGGQRFNTNLQVPSLAGAKTGSASFSCSSYSSCLSKCSSAAPSGCCSGGGSCLNYCGSSNCQSRCSWTLYPSSSMCVQVSWSNTSGWANTNHYCDYPFNSQKFTCSSNSGGISSFALRSTNDPYVILQSITDGSNSFGLTAAQQRGIGIALIGVGGAFFAASIFVCVLIKNACTQHEHKARVYEAFGRSYQYPAGYAPLGQPIQQQYAPQPAYSAQQQSPYGAAQPQPGYAQPYPQQQPYPPPQQPYPQQPYPQQPYPQQPYPQQPYPQQQPYGAPPPQPGYQQYPPQQNVYP